MKTVKINDEGFLESPYITNATHIIEISDYNFEKTSIFKVNTNWRYVDGDFVIVELNDDGSLRNRRQLECFDIIDNRSKLWYDTLTEEQYDELKTWYEAWLKVTETKVVPVKPEWFK